MKIEQLNFVKKTIKKPYLSASAIFFLIIFILFWPFFLKGEIIAPTDLLLNYKPWSILKPAEYKVKNPLRSDVIDSFLPTLNFFQKEIKNKTMPLWNPYKAQGMPFFPLLFYSLINPLTGILFSIIPLPYAFSLLIIGKLFLMGLFTFIFLRKLKLSFWPAITGSVIYMLSGFNVVWLSWPHTLVTMFTPLLFLVVENLVQNPKVKNAIFLSITVAFMLFSGFPAVAGYSFYAVGIYFLMRFTQKYLKKNKKIILKLCFLFSLGFVIGILLSAIQLLPTLEFFKFINISYRKTQSLSHLPLKSMIQVIFPNYFGNPAYHNWHGHSNFNETSGYIGIISLALLLASLIFGVGRKKVLIAFFFFLSLVSLLIIYNIGPFLYLIHNLPVFNTSSSTRLLSIFGFSGSIAAALGFQLCQQEKASFFRKKMWFLVSGIVYALSVLFVVYRVYYKYNYIYSSLNPVFYQFIFFKIFYILLPISLLFISFWLYLSFINEILSKRLFNFLVFGLIFIDLFSFAYRQNPTVSKKYFYPLTPGIKFLQQNLKDYERIAPFDGTFMIPGTQFYYNLNSSFSHNFYSLRHKKLINKFSPHAFQTPTAIVPKSANTNFFSPLIDLLGIKYIVLKPEGKIYSLTIRQEKSNIPAGPIWKDRSITQSFKITKDNQELKKVCLLMATYSRKNRGTGVIKILNPQNQVIASKSFDISQILDNRWSCFEFNTTPFSKGNYYLKISSNATRENAITIWSYNQKDNYRDGELLDGNGDLAFRMLFLPPTNQNKYILVYENPKEITIYQNLNFTEAFLVNKVEKALPDELLEILNSPRFNPYEVAYIEEDVPKLLMSSKVDPNRKVMIKEYQPNFIIYETSSKTPSLLVTHELFYPGWEVFIDGKKSKIYRTNYIFKGVAIPPGKHAIKFIYNPKSFKIGLSVSGTTGLIIVCFSIINYLRKRKSHPQTKIFSIQS